MATKTIEKTKSKKAAPKAAKNIAAKNIAAKTTIDKSGIDKSALVSKVAYFILYVPDMTKAIAFYKSIGLTPAFESPEWTEFNAGIKFALHGPCEDSCDTYEASETNISFGVNSAKATYETFKAMGIKVTSEPRNVCESGYCFSFQDCFGNELSAYGPL
jgi:predicted enzyme related to lactoylglutathione lyase